MMSIYFDGDIYILAYLGHNAVVTTVSIRHNFLSIHENHRANDSFGNYSHQFACILLYICLSKEEKIHAAKKAPTGFRKPVGEMRCAVISDPNGNYANLTVATGEHPVKSTRGRLALRRGPGVGDQQFEAGEELNASLAQLATIGRVCPVQFLEQKAADCGPPPDCVE